MPDAGPMHSVSARLSQDRQCYQGGGGTGRTTIGSKRAMATRTPTHAGSWYDSNPKRLSRQLDDHLANVTQTGSTFPLADCKAVIAPHAGYSFSGPAAAWAYKSIQTSHIKRVFLLGPSHHVYLDGCALSKCKSYGTPLGDLALDQETIGALKVTKKFSEMSIATDEDEHSLEMHLPYIRKIFGDQDIKIVPILVGAISNAAEKEYGRILADYYRMEDVLFIVSSDFAHWGNRFRYTYYAPPNGPAISLKGSTVDASALKHYPIHESISKIDHEGMSIIESQPSSTAHDDFTAYLKRTSNTICGRHPIGVLLATLAAAEEAVGKPRSNRVKFIRYEQSSQCKSLSDSSVSYASAVVTSSM